MTMNDDEIDENKAFLGAEAAYCAGLDEDIFPFVCFCDREAGIADGPAREVLLAISHVRRTQPRAPLPRRRPL